MLKFNNFVIRKSNRLNIKEGDVLRCIDIFPYSEFKWKIGELFISAHFFDNNKNEWWELVDVYLLSDETLKSGDLVLTDNYGVWKFKEILCSVHFWGNPNTCRKILKSTNYTKYTEKFYKEELNILIKQYNEFIN